MENSNNDAADAESGDDESACSQIESPAPKSKRRRKELSRSDKVLDMVAESLQSSLNAKPSEHEQFGKYVSHELISLTPKQVTIAKKLINDVIYEGKMENLNINSKISTNSSLAQTPIRVAIPCSSNDSTTNSEQLTDYFSTFQPL